MFDEDFEPAPGRTLPTNLESMSVDELADYIGDLKAEIMRVEAEAERKKASLAAADSIFGS